MPPYVARILRLGLALPKGWRPLGRRIASKIIGLLPRNAGRITMRKTLMLTAALLAFSAGAASAQKPVKIGFISTFSGPAAAIGDDMRKSFELALDHHGRKLGG